MPDRPGIAFADLSSREVPGWLSAPPDRDPSEPLLVSPHWGPNMVPAPVAHVRSAAAALLDAGVALVAGHSAHVFHGVTGQVLFDLGDFVDDYRVDRVLRNDLGLLWFVDLDAGRPVRLEAVPLKLDFCHTRLAEGADAEWVLRRFAHLCAELGTAASEKDGRAILDL
jgi:poly-gamma-glutamate synthesis protein (capsule biosynthesis protein)